MATKTETLQAAPPRLIGSLQAGFDTVASHIGLILFPVALDIILWFGPHLSLKSLLQPLIDTLMASPELNTPDRVDVMHATRDLWQGIIQTLNLTTSLRTYPVGIPSLEAGKLPQATPFGIAPTIDVQSFAAVFGIFLALSMIGLLGGSLYFSAIARALATPPLGASLGESVWAAAQTIFLTLGWICLILAIGLPGFFIILLLAYFSMALAQLGILVVVVLVAWLLVPLLFSPHGIFLFRQNAFSSMLTSVRLVRFLLPGTGMFFLTVVIISQGLDLLWKIPADTSWLAVVAIAGHGFIATGLVAASFVYYRDAMVFVRELLAHSAAAQHSQSKV